MVCRRALGVLHAKLAGKRDHQSASRDAVHRRVIDLRFQARLMIALLLRATEPAIACTTTLAISASSALPMRALLDTRITAFFEWAQICAARASSELSGTDTTICLVWRLSCADGGCNRSSRRLKFNAPRDIDDCISDAAVLDTAYVARLASKRGVRQNGILSHNSVKSCRYVPTGRSLT